MEKKWVFKNTPSTGGGQEVVSRLETDLGIPRPLAVMLWQRGISSFEEARHFFRPQLSDLHDPFLMKDMDRAVDRLTQAVETGEKILVYGDYDVDGTTAVAMVYDFIRKFHPAVLYYNPDRYTEGYGVSQKGIDYALSEGVTLIISLDCGIKAADKVAYAAARGVDFIICDHHEPGDELPAAVAVLDPKRKDCAYPYKELTGNGVGFKLLSAYCLQHTISFRVLEEYLDLVMVSIASDIVPITGENRILAFYGLQKLNTGPRVSLKALMSVAGVQGEMSVESVVFTIGPRINAAGRIRHARAAVELLLSEDREEAMALAYEIQAHNTERKGLDSRITDEAMALIRQDSWLLNEARSTVLYSESWHKGVIGIVASRCIEQFYRPTVIFTKSGEGLAAGSARSVTGFDLYSAIEACSGYLVQFGGHMHAAGMTIELDRINDFRKAFDEAVRASLTEEQRVPVIHADLEISLAELTPKFQRIMKQMAPFGPQNMQPVFVSHNLRTVSEPKVLKEKHLKMDVQQDGSAVVFPAIGFGLAEPFYEQVRSGKPFSMAYSLEENTFRDKTTLQLFIRDIKF
ncbi:single-stranded-DNA-specific exonuclease RecJ [Leadbetterella sp. DM7]|uniref:single-stranded-DNA-specific exonuclease RecJ n=1 Tax=Leadbetterella sp. DM7 TaxID=3235085 RepID=UPI00349F0236